MPEEETDMMTCPECGGTMAPDLDDPEMLKCASCGHTMDKAEGDELGLADEEQA